MKTVLLSICLAISFNLYAQDYQIGHRQITWIDSSRNNRPVKFEVYYPASTTADNVPVISNGKKFPVVVFGHGYQLTYTDYVWLKDSLVPKGFFLAFPRTEEQVFPSHTDFAKDFAFIVDQFDKNKNNATQWFYNRLNSRYAVSGHSMGGGCSLLSIQYSNKINAVYNFAAAETNPSAIAACASINISSLLFAGGKDCISPPASNQQPMYNNLQPYCKTYVEITKAQHCHWSNNGSCAAGQIFCAGLATPAKPTLSTTFSLLLPWLNGTLYNNRNEALRFQTLLQSATGITFQQSCGLINGGVAISNIEQTGKLKIFPSLTTDAGFVSIQLPAINNTGLLQLSNQNGEVVYTKNVAPQANQTIKLSTSGLQKGIYFVMINANEKVYKGSFVIQ